jgi:hypothetical protein
MLLVEWHPEPDPLQVSINHSEFLD